MVHTCLTKHGDVIIYIRVFRLTLWLVTLKSALDWCPNLAVGSKLWISGSNV